MASRRLNTHASCGGDVLFICSYMLGVPVGNQTGVYDDCLLTRTLMDFGMHALCTGINGLRAHGHSIRFRSIQYMSRLYYIYLDMYVCTKHSKTG